MPSNKKSGSFNKQREIEKKRRKRRKKRLITSILIMLITIIVLYLLNSPTFKIKNIEVMGNSQVDKQKIIEQSGIKIGNSIFSNINIISKNAVTQYVGGLIGQISLGKVENCYVSEGKISSEKKGLGGLVGYSSTTTSVEISNCYTNIEIRSEDDKIGGILGNDAGTDLNNVSHNFSVGNIYSSKESEDISRAVGNSLEEENNYAYQGQRINGYIVNDELGAKLLSYNELCIQDTYTNIIGLGDAYDYSQVSQGILPKLYDTTGEWLLPNQEDVNIDNNLNLEIGNIKFEKLTNGLYE